MTRRLAVALALFGLSTLPATAAPGFTALTVDGSTIRVHLDADTVDLSADRYDRWVDKSTHIVANYYGRFPVPAVDITLAADPDRSGVISGQTFGQGPFIRVEIGRHTTGKQLDHDWVMVHEMVHLAFPSVGRQHLWIEEGLATYIESVARVNAGDLDAAFVWRGFVRQMPKGLPAAGDRGLDRTHTWGRTYWGGALFCLLADVEIRQRTDGRFGLRDALRAILAAGYNNTVEADLATVLAVADQRLGVSVLTELYNSMKATPVTPDLAALWQRLGIVDGGTRFDDQAPLAWVRQQIMAPTAPRPATHSETSD